MHQDDKHKYFHKLLPFWLKTKNPQNDYWWISSSSSHPLPVNSHARQHCYHDWLIELKFAILLHRSFFDFLNYCAFVLWGVKFKTPIFSNFPMVELLYIDIRRIQKVAGNINKLSLVLAWWKFETRSNKNHHLKATIFSESKKEDTPRTINYQKITITRVVPLVDDPQAVGSCTQASRLFFDIYKGKICQNWPNSLF